MASHSLSAGRNLLLFAPGNLHFINSTCETGCTSYAQSQQVLVSLLIPARLSSSSTCQGFGAFQPVGLVGVQTCPIHQRCPAPAFPAGWEAWRVPRVGGLCCFPQAACSRRSSFRFSLSPCGSRAAPAVPPEACSEQRSQVSAVAAASERGRCRPGWGPAPVNRSAGSPGSARSAGRSLPR